MQKTIGQAAEESGIGIETIRYYEREGIIPKVERAGNGRRQFGSIDVSRLKFLKRFRSLGFSIPDIIVLQELAYSNGGNCQKAASIGERNLEIVQAKIFELQEIEAALKNLVRQCAEYPAQCPMLLELETPLNEKRLVDR